MFKEPWLSSFPLPNSIPSYLPQASFHLRIPRTPHAQCHVHSTPHCHVHLTPHYNVHPKHVAMCTPYLIAMCTSHLITTCTPNPLPCASHTSLPHVPQTLLACVPTPWCHVCPHPIASCSPHPPHMHLIHAQPQTSLTSPPHKYHMRSPYYYMFLTLSPHVPHPSTHASLQTYHISFTYMHFLSPAHLHLHTHTQMHLTCICMCTSYMYVHLPNTHTYMYLTHRPPHTPQTDQGRSSP